MADVGAKRDAPGTVTSRAPLQEAPLVDILKRSTAWLEGRGLPKPRLDVEWILAHVLGLDRLALYMQFDRPLMRDELDAIRALVIRRGGGEPLAYVLGTWSFHGIDLKTDARALVPRPETETLVDALLARVPDQAAMIADVGTGSGCVALALLRARPMWTALASDISADALALARENAQALGCADRMTLAAGPLLAPWREHPSFGELDAVVANPPYIVRGDPSLEAHVAAHEPAQALYVPGDDALEIVAALAEQAIAALRPGGLFASEIGHRSGEGSVSRLRALGFRDVATEPDLNGTDRVVLGVR